MKPINIINKLNESDGFIQECPMCGQCYELTLDEKDLDKAYNYSFGSGAIQDLFPNLNPLEREFIKSGYCPACQEMMFGTEYKSDKIKRCDD